jgi:type IV pilus assembly protein PilV
MRLKMTTPMTTRKQQSGAYLLEALIGILIFALGVLGIVGLQAASLKTTGDSGLRAEAVFAANQLLGQMWTDDINNLNANYDSTLGGQPYLDFAALLKTVQGGAWACDPTVTFGNFAGAPSQTSRTVTIQVFWASDTGEVTAGCATPHHSYTTSGVVGQNQ